MAAQTTKCPNTEVFFGASIGVPPSAANTSVEEFLIVAPIPGSAPNGAYDGRANPMIVYRLFLDTSGPLD